MCSCVRVCGPEGGVTSVMTFIIMTSTLDWRVSSPSNLNERMNAKLHPAVRIGTGSQDKDHTLLSILYLWNIRSVHWSSEL